MSTPEALLGQPALPAGLPDMLAGPADLPVQPAGQDPEEDLIRGDVQDWPGGRPVNLDRKTAGGKTVREELSAHLKETLDQELKNQEGLVAKLKRWQKLYKSEKRGNRPKPWMADVSIPVARKISDSIFVRIHDMVWNKVRVFLFRARGQGTPELNAKMAIWERAFNNYIRNDLGLKEKMIFPTRQAVNSGTGVVKIVYETKNKTIYRYASDEDKLNPATKKYRLPGTKDTVVKEPSIVFRGPNVYPVDRARFVISSDALSIEDAYLVGFSFDKRKKQLETLAAKGIYDKSAVGKLSASRPDENAEDRAKAAGTELRKTPYTEPYTLYEIWFRYDVDGDGEEDDIVVTFHRESGEILKAIYNPIFYGYRPFADMKGASQVAYTYDGEGICEIIEVMSEELDSLHNLMLDRMKLCNLPLVFAQAGIGLDNYELEPGTIKVIDTPMPKESVYLLPQPDITYSIVNEVNWLIGQMDLVCGITPGALGLSTAERPVFKETVTVNEEANKKFKSWTDRARECYREIGFKLLEAFAQYQPVYEFTDENGIEQSVEMPNGNIRDYLDLDLTVSSEEWNMTMRRETELLKYQLLSDYLTKNAGMAQMLTSPGVPSEFKKYLLQADLVGSRAVEKVLENFDDQEKQSQVVSMAKVMDVQKCVMNSVDLIQAQQAQQAQMAQAMGMPAGQPGQPEEQGQPAERPAGAKEGNLTVNYHEGDKVSK